MSSEMIMTVVFVLLKGCVIEGGVARLDGRDYYLNPTFVHGIASPRRIHTGVACSAVIVDGRRHFMVGSPLEIKEKLENAGR